MVFVGAGIGGMLRHAVTAASSRMFGPELPMGTLLVNVVGSLAAGLVVGHALTMGYADPRWRLLVVTGLLGGFTTFSTFSLEAVHFWERGQLVVAAAYAGGSVLLALSAVFIGLAVTRG